MNSSLPHISIIIPCYNAKVEHLQQAINSVLNYKGNFTYEIIIIDDGSTNEHTLALLNDYERQAINIIHQPNQGPSSARNNGVKQAKGEFLLCLDSDNKINPAYIDAGINRLLKSPKVAVVYGRPEFIAEADRGKFETGDFNIERLLTESYIDMCAVIRKKAWEEVNGLDECLRQYEDWDFWLHLYKAAWEFIFIDEPMFEYRIREESLMSQSGKENFEKTVEYLYKKHWDLVYRVYHQLYARNIMYKNDMKRPLRSFFKYMQFNLKNEVN